MRNSSADELRIDLKTNKKWCAEKVEGEKNIRRGLAEVVSSENFNEGNAKIAEVRVELATVLRRLGNFRDAAKELRLAQEAEALPFSRLLRDLGQVRSHFHWNHLGAEKDFLAALRILEPVLGSDHKEVANIKYNLGHALRRQGRRAEAKEIWETVLRIQLEQVA